MKAEVKSGQSEALLAELRAAIGEAHVLTGEAVRRRSAGIWGDGEGLVAGILVRPADTAGVSRILEICNRRRQPVVTHGGLTGVVDGARAQASDVVLSMERLTGVEEVDVVGSSMTVLAGTPLQVVQEAAAEHGLLFPLDMGARGSATIGGNAATNAGGNRVIRYGMTRPLVLGLEAVLADGTVVSSMNRMLKNNAGYDLKQLFIGSEGTLGIITRLILRLYPEPKSQATAFVAMDNFEQVTKLLAFADRAFGGTLSAYEVLWSDYFELVAAGARSMPLPVGYPHYVVIEALGSDPAPDAARFESALSRAQSEGLVADAVIAKSQRERDAIWAIRDDVVRLLELEPMFLFDVSLPIRHIEAYIDSVRARLSDHWPEPRLFVFGHLGDGNIHLAISAGPASGDARSEVEDIVYGPLREVGGSVSAEHGIGLEKKAYLSWCRSAEEIALMRTLKAALDPNGILNPGKVFD